MKLVEILNRKTDSKQLNSHNMKNKSIFLSILIFLTVSFSYGQGSPDYNGGLKIKFGEDGKKYVRVLLWVQGQINYKSKVPPKQEKTTMQLRRARVLMYAQITPKFMVLTHFGMGSLNPNSLSPTGKGDASQLFMHDAWAQYNFTPSFTVGMGLHYFNGISRLNNQSSLNLLTLSNNRASWSTMGLSDQFGRHIGVFAKGNIQKLQYQLAISDALVKTLDTRDPGIDVAVYRGKELLGRKAGKTVAGYFQYSFLDSESNFLPFRVGTYLGGKKVFNIGTGFFVHPKGAVVLNKDGNMVGENVSIFAIDAFYDTPLSDRGNAITAYAVYQNNNYGKNFSLGPYGTGDMMYGHIGYLFAGDKNKMRFQPYTSFSTNKYEVLNERKNRFGLGINAYLSGHNAKFTLEYANEKLGDNSNNFVNFQAMIYL